MKPMLVDAIVIIAGALFLTVLSLTGTLEVSAKFMLIPFMIFYFAGKYAGKRLR